MIESVLPFEIFSTLIQGPWMEHVLLLIQPKTGRREVNAPLPPSSTGPKSIELWRESELFADDPYLLPLAWSGSDNYMYLCFVFTRLLHYKCSVIDIEIIDVICVSKLLTRSSPGNKVQLFLEGHKNLRNLPHGFVISLVKVKTMRKIAQFFVAFSEKLNFILKR